MKKFKIENVCKSDLCTGCGLCASVFTKKVKIINNINGFLRPVQFNRLDSSEYELFKNICPGVSIRRESYDIDKKNYDPIWGKIISLISGYANDDNIRYLGSSGGCLSSILIYLLDANKIDFVINIHTSKKDPLENAVQVCKTKEEIIESMGSRYSPSSPLKDIKRILNKSGRYAIVAKPCDIYALRNYFKYDKKINGKILYYISFFCAGVPSYNATREILAKFNVKEKNLKSIKYRGEGWPGKTKISTIDGKIYEMNYIECWSDILGRNVQFRCKICPDGIGEFADIVFADAWHIENGKPVFKEKNGKNIIITRTKKGNDILIESIKNKYIRINNINYNHKMLSKCQSYHKLRKKMVFSRILALAILGKSFPKYINMGIYKAAIKSSIYLNIKSFIGMIKRVLITKKK